MLDDEAFLQAIIDNPDDDLPRLVYADYLDERGDGERAEFIRVQCELDRTANDHPQFARFFARAEDVLRGNGERWLGPLADFVYDFVFRRGFIERISLSAIAFVAYAEEIAQRAPVRWLALREDAWEEMEYLAAIPLLGRLSHLCLANNHLESDGVVALLKSPHLNRLAELDLRHNRLNVYAMQALASCPTLACLSSMDVGGNDVGAEGVNYLSRSETLRRLTTLGLASSGIGPAGVEELANGSGLPELTTLDLSDNRIGRRGIRALIHGQGLRRLQRLCLHGVDVAHDQQTELNQRFGPEVCVFD